MRHTLLTLTVAVSLLLGTSLRADDFVFGRFGDYLDALRSQAGIPGLAAAVVGTNDILWEHAFGKQDLERLVATRTDAPFETDGLTQMFAATLVLRCVEDGSLWLDEPIAQFDPGSPYANATIRQILTTRRIRRLAWCSLTAPSASSRWRPRSRRAVPRSTERSPSCSIASPWPTRFQAWT
jgi:CubicO group peptidase (beta-lactamase class C family)